MSKATEQPVPEEEAKTGELLPPEQVIAEYKPFLAQLETLKKANKATVFDYADPKGNAAARSYVYKLRQTGAAIDKARKGAKAGLLERGKLIDAQAKMLRGEVDTMIDAHQQAIDEVEKKEQQRIEDHQLEISVLRNIVALDYFPDGKPLDSKAYKENLGKLEAAQKAARDFQEFQETANKVISEGLLVLQSKYQNKLNEEAERAELERLRKEQAERDEAARIERERIEREEREERIKAQAIEAERKAAAEREAKAREEDQRQRDEERKAAEARETELKLQAERAEHEAAEQKRAAEKAERDAQERAEQAARDTEARILREQQAAAELERRAQERREADRKNRAKVETAAANALEVGGLEDEAAKLAIRLIAAGSVPNVTITY